jgi:hypothetical protein
MICERTSAPLKTPLAPRVGTNSPEPAAEFASARVAPPDKYHRRNSIHPHLSAPKRPSKPFIFNVLQKSAQVIECNRFQPTYFHTHAHSFPGSPLLTAFYTLGTGVYIPSPPPRLAARTNGVLHRRRFFTDPSTILHRTFREARNG